MCGRFTLRTKPSAWCQLFLPHLDPDTLATQYGMENLPRYNIAPTQSVACIVWREVRQPWRPAMMRWGLVPAWADDLSIGNRMINARGETIDSKPSFRRAFASRRCLVLADGYFEWKKIDGGKQPYLIQQPGSGPFAMAGLWEENSKVTADGSKLATCTIITTEANQVTREVHDRMPVILAPDQQQPWLDPTNRDTGQLKSLLRPATGDLLRLTPVSQRVNSPKNDDAACIEPVTI